jgi:adenylosuccinate synthase
MKYISDSLGVEVGMISTGPERDASIVCRDTHLEAWLEA